VLAKRVGGVPFNRTRPWGVPYIHFGA